MLNHTEDFEVETLEQDGVEIKLLSDDRENLAGALAAALEIFSAPGEADPNRTVETIETLEDVLAYFADPKVSDLIGEIIELLHEICDDNPLSFGETQNGKFIVRRVTQALGLKLSQLDE